MKKTCSKCIEYTRAWHAL